jgi:hypothetical protein
VTGWRIISPFLDRLCFYLLLLSSLLLSSLVLSSVCCAQPVARETGTPPITAVLLRTSVLCWSYRSSLSLAHFFSVLLLIDPVSFVPLIVRSLCYLL